MTEVKEKVGAWKSLKGKVRFVLAFFIALTISFVCYRYGHGRISAEDKAIIDRAYLEAEKSIESHAAAVRQAVLDRKKECKDVADKITGYVAMLKRIKGEEALKKHVDDVISKNLISEDWCMKLVSREVAGFIIDLRDIEDKLARETDCPALSVSHMYEGSLKYSAVTNDGSRLTNAMMKQVLTDIASLVGGEAAAMLALSTGIFGTAASLSWSTLGVSVGVGIVVDVVARWVINPAGEVAKQLNEALDMTAERQFSAFRKAMKHHLDLQRKRWTKEILRK